MNLPERQLKVYGVIVKAIVAIAAVWYAAPKQMIGIYIFVGGIILIGVLFKVFG